MLKIQYCKKEVTHILTPTLKNTNIYSKTKASPAKAAVSSLQEDFALLSALWKHRCQLAKEKHRQLLPFLLPPIHSPLQKAWWQSMGNPSGNKLKGLFLPGLGKTQCFLGRSLTLFHSPATMFPAITQDSFMTWLQALSWGCAWPLQHKSLLTSAEELNV